MRKAMQEFEDAFIKVSFEEDTPESDLKEKLPIGDPMYKSWANHCKS